MEQDDKNNDIVEFEDVENYKGSVESLFQSIILKQLTKTLDEGSKAMDFGGERKVFDDATGKEITIIVPDQTEIFINHCDVLKSAVQHRINQFPELYKEDMDKFYFELSNEKHTAFNSNDFGKYQEEQSKGIAIIKKNDMVYNKLRKVKVYREQLLPILTRVINEKILTGENQYVHGKTK
jgi:hypothetical protein